MVDLLQILLKDDLELKPEYSASVYKQLPIFMMTDSLDYSS
jgi:hypothetical protein